MWLFMAMFGVGFILIAGFVPPPQPTADPDQIAQLFRAHSLAIRVGMCVCVLGSGFLLPWGGAISAQLRRIEGWPALTHTWTAANALLTVEFIFPCLWWAVAAFRPESDAQLIQRFNDMAWLSFMGIISTALIQCLVLAVATFQDNSSDRIYPRWFGYYQLWTLVLLTPDLVVYCFKTGPVAWNGIFAFWTEITIAGLWLILTAHMTARAARRPTASRERSASVEERLAALEAHMSVATRSQ